LLNRANEHVVSGRHVETTGVEILAGILAFKIRFCRLNPFIKLFYFVFRNQVVMPVIVTGESFAVIGQTKNVPETIVINNESVIYSRKGDFHIGAVRGNDKATS
ncbi:MAG: hypothetical protein EBR82_70785, partial [Caulobacteraceae bacterium]|nr:hypothetical protein [Caulobacteraceae bacterium]